MPLYRCTLPAGTLDDAGRGAVARVITDIHCELTGAPPTFVHVQFFDTADPGDQPTIHGGIRAGRDDDLTTKLIDRCVTEVGALVGMTPTMRTSATKASWIFEGGRVFPEPGAEDDWLSDEE